MKWGAFLILVSFAFIISEIYLLLIKPAEKIEAILQEEYASLFVDQDFQEIISMDVRQQAEEIRVFNLSTLKNGVALSSLITFRWVVIQSLFPPILIAGGVGISEGVLKRTQRKESVGFFSPRQFHLAIWMLGAILFVFFGHLISPRAVSVSAIGIFSIWTTGGCFYWIASNFPGVL